MKKTYNNKYNLYHINTDGDGFILHRIGSDSYSHIHHAVVPSADIDNWEEIAIADIPSYTQADYKAKVIELIRQRYSIDDETAILRQRDTKPEEFDAYNTYAEECKAEARLILKSKSEVIEV